MHYRPIFLSALVAGALLALAPAQAGLLKPGEDSKAPASEKKAVEVILVATPEGDATTTFAPDIAKIYLLWKGESFKAGDKVRAVWTADDVGDAAPKNTKIDEATLTVEEAKAHGSMSLSKPNNNFPVGDYHVDLYVNDDVAATARFTVAR